MSKTSAILDEFGRPFVHANGKPRPELQRAIATTKREKSLDARYDAAQDTTWLQTYYAAADSLDADSANSREVRSKLVPRARYEAGNNGFMAGMLNSFCDFFVGSGPTLRMQTPNAGFNQAVELLFTRWAKAIGLRRKLWTMTHAKVQDGEALGILGTNTRLPGPMQLDVKLIETEQCQSPYLAAMQEDYIDGIRLHPSGDAQWYEILKFHPGSNNAPFNRLESNLVPAEEVLHFFRTERPGQHRGVPEFKSTLNTGAASRRFREATVQAAEAVADLNVIFETPLPADTNPEVLGTMSAMPLQKGMATVAPFGNVPHHIKSEHPSPAYEMFIRSQLTETARPKCIPYNVAAGDSSGYNFASGKLDHQTFYLAITVERLDADDLVLDKLFARWWMNAIEAYGWGGDPLSPPEHSWQWPRHPVADEQAQANADDTKLRGGMMTLTRYYDERGLDFEDELEVMAQEAGVTVEEMRTILLRNRFGAAVPTDADEPDPGEPDASGGTADPAAPAVEGEQEIKTLPSQTLNGAQIASATAIVQQVAQGLLPRDSGIGQLQVLLNLSKEQAEQVMGTVGNGFTPPVTQPQSPPSKPAANGPSDQAPSRDEAEPDSND